MPETTNYNRATPATMKHPALRLFTGLVMFLAWIDPARGGHAVIDGDGGAVILAREHALPATGTLLTEDSSNTMDGATWKAKIDDQDIIGSMTQQQLSKITREILAANKLRYVLASKTTTGRTKINGKENAAPQKKDPLEGIPVILERKDGKWSASLEHGDHPSAKQQAALNKLVAAAEKDSDFGMYGDTPRKPGDKWDVDPDKLTDFGDAEGLTGKCRVEFLEIMKFRNVRCAVLKATFDLKGKTQDLDDGSKMDIHLKGEAITHRSIADMIDLDVVVDGMFTTDGSPKPQMTMHMEGPIRVAATMTVQKP